jgi:hypothetical protein
MVENPDGTKTNYSKQTFISHAQTAVGWHEQDMIWYEGLKAFKELIREHGSKVGLESGT